MAHSSPFFGNVKDIPLATMREMNWGWQTDVVGLADSLSAFKLVPLVHRAVDIRAKAVQTMPFDIFRGDSDISVMKDPRYDGITSRMDNLLWATEAALCVYGRSYLHIDTNTYGLNVTPRWMHPTTITPLFTNEGVAGFRRTMSGKNYDIAPNQVVYTWYPALDKELGPGLAPVDVALAAAGVLHNMDEFIAGYFARGIIKATLLTIEGNPSKEEMDKLQAWWKRLLGGVKKAYESVAIRASIKPVVIGDSLSETSAPELTAQKREDALIALGVPLSLVMSNASNFATAQQDDVHFYTKTVIPECDLIAETFNEQLLAPLGLRLEFQPKKLPVMQAAELLKAKALSEMVGQPVYSLNEARAVMGLDPVPGGDWDLVPTPPTPAISGPIPPMLPMPQPDAALVQAPASTTPAPTAPTVDAAAVVKELRAARREVARARKAREAAIETAEPEPVIAVLEGTEA